MISPDLLPLYGKKMAPETEAFVHWLKANADDDDLDLQTKKLHDELFSQYDCSACRNCCKLMHGSIPKSDIEKDAEFLGVSSEYFKSMYLEKGPSWDDKINTKHLPCDFLRPDDTCMLMDERPDDCKTYPYTGKPEVAYRLYGIASTTLVCPVSYEIFERLKKHYNFKFKERRR